MVISVLIFKKSPKSDFSDSLVINLTTFDILQMVQGIIPQTPIDEHDVFEVMQELGFEYKLIGFQHITDDKEFVSYGYRWILYKK